MSEELQNPVSGKLKKLTLEEFLALFDPEVHDGIRAAIARYPDCEGIVCMENLQMDSSQFGARSALVMGPSNSWPLVKVKEAGFRLGDVPSRFQYPTAYVDYRKEAS